MRRPGRVYDFGHFRLDPTEQVLLCAGKPVPLTPKAFAVLQVLVDNAGHVVEKHELMQAVWADSVVEEANLPQTIWMLRRVLGEGHRGHQSHEYIETVARRGYRFAAAVKTHDQSAGLSIEGIEAADRTPERDSEGGEVGERSTHDVSASEWVAKRSSENEETHHLYFRGRYHWSKYTVDGLQEAIQQFRQAIKRDHNYALAYAGLADCYYRLSNIHLPPWEAMPKAKAIVLKALKIDDRLPEAHSLLGLIKMFYYWDWLVAETEFTRAIELAPNCAVAHQRYGLALGMLGRFDEAIAEMKLALERAPLSPQIHIGLGTVFHLARDYHQTIKQADRALDLSADAYGAHVLLGMAYVQQRRLKEAVGEFEEAVSRSDSPLTQGYLGYAYGVSGKPRRALKILAELERRSESAYVSPYALALVHAGLHHSEQALRLLERTCEDRNEMVGFVKLSPELDGLRSDPRFAAMLKRSRFPAMSA